MEFISPFSVAVCDSPAPLAHFNGAAYMGTWYEQNHVKHQFFEPDDSTCVEAQYSNLQADGHFTVYNSLQDANFDARYGKQGTGYCPDATGHCFVHFGGPQPTKSNYQIVATDYTSYSVVYACGGIKEFLWLLSRQPVASDALYN